MRALFLPLTLLSLTAAVPAQSGPHTATAPAYTAAAPSQSAAEAPPRGNCRDRIQQVRDASGQPALDTVPARPGEGYLINAVDLRLDGCAVMQMKGNVNDLRPLPAPAGPARLRPAH